MKTKMLITVIFIFIFIRCVGWYPFEIKNNSDTRLSVSLADGYYGMNLYPDTTMPVIVPSTLEIRPHDYNNFLSRFEWEQTFDVIPSKVLSVYFFNADTFEHYDWEILRIRKDLVLKRYDLTLEELQQSNWTISYP